MTTTLDPAALWRAELMKTLVARGVSPCSHTVSAMRP